MVDCTAPISSDILWAELALLAGVILAVIATRFGWRPRIGLLLGIGGIVLLGAGFLILTGLVSCLGN